MPKSKPTLSPAQLDVREVARLLFALTGLRSRIENLSTTRLPPGLLCGLHEAVPPIDEAITNVRRWNSERHARLVKGGV